MKEPYPTEVKVWDVPLRIWHWLFAGVLVVSLVTGLVAELSSMLIHKLAGFGVLSLLVFRLLWGLRGATYARWSRYWTTPRHVWEHFRGRGKLTPHTAPGICIALLFVLTVLLQATSGLFMTDDVFFEGPLYDLASDDVADAIEVVHENAWRGLVTLISIHLIAQIVYLVLLRNKTPMSMFTGKKPVQLPATEERWWWACSCLCFAMLTFYNLISWSD